ncbi:hypothetical protein G6F46_009008 [Rhizopus delemar]|uniref:RING-type domain-containing protein n=2 Tax=Rhizopus TaxID=4842 RepID=A0A9P6YYW8_9FUNG|nr:hypothetical protein G6F55_006161 [Rhizopus delemar]KAG1541144.1 hypothetical protein G6F51_008079 [Rhizopus arrhizus]KAG1493564.1 hypothetical protein G6F54_008485 [Rhizopus delemar]KAG1507637.1 hypothetical protein G6F53_008798 [Rhizopus delemar]KAG1523258.1 hypothetical protein G6F52_005169 [Rhizopus delemar]
MSSDEEDTDCPLCMEELDIADRNFRPCACGYQICRFCWHHIKTNLNGRCPACRRLYSEQIVEFIPVSAEEVMRLKKEKKEKDRQTREMRDPSRRQLSSIRVVQKNLVYVLGMSLKHAYVENEIFRKYGKIDKVVISKRTTNNAPAGIYITFTRKEDASKAIEGLNGIEVDGKTVRASFGTTKYCTYYLRHMSCPNPNCMYLHEPGDDVDSFNKDTVTIGKHVTPSSTSVYPNKRPATAAKQEASKIPEASKTPGAEIKPPTTTPRTWAPIPKVVPIPPVVIEEVPAEKPSPTQEYGPAKEKSKTVATSPSVAPMKASRSNTTKKTTDKLKKVSKPNEEESTKPALPPTASWAKAQPILPQENVITPTNFGPSLSDAVQTVQKPKHILSGKVKKEKRGKSRMVRLEEFEEAKKVAQQPKSTHEVHEKETSVQSEQIPTKNVHSTPAVIGMCIEDEAVVVKETAINDDETEEEKIKDSIEKQNVLSETEKRIEESTLENLEVTGQTKEPCSVKAEAEEEIVLDEQTQLDGYLSKEDHRNDFAQTTEEPNVTAPVEKVAQQNVFNSEDIVENEDSKQEEALATLNESVIKAFDSNMSGDLSVNASKKVQHEQDDGQPSAVVNSSLNDHIPSPLVAMERLSTLVEQEISSNTPQQPTVDRLSHPLPPSDNYAPFTENKRQPMPPPGLGPPPILPEWMNRGFDPFNGQDPSLIAARRLQHSQRMMEASGLFGLNNGFPPHRPAPPLPSISPFGFHPNFNEGVPGFPHQPPPPFTNIHGPPPHHHPMMRPPPPQNRVNMPHFGSNLPPRHLSMDDTNRLRAEFNAMALNGRNREEFQSREDLRALLPNVNISFNNNNNQQKGPMDHIQHQELGLKRMDIQENIASSNSINSMPPNHSMKFHPPLEQNKAPFYKQDSFGQQGMGDRLPQNINLDVRTEAQNFFGEFLRKAASSNQQETSNKKEEEYGSRTENPLPFQDPAIMSVHLTENSINEPSNQSTMLQILGGQPPPAPMPQQQQQQQQQSMHQRPDPRFGMNEQRIMYLEPGFDERRQPFGNNMFMPPGFRPPQPQPPPPPQQQQQHMFNHQNGLQQQPPPQFVPHFLEPSINTMGHMAGNPMMRPPMMLFHQDDNRFKNTGNIHHGDIYK